MAGRRPSTVLDFARAVRSHAAFESRDPLRTLTDQLGETIANAADADQWTTFVEGVDCGGYTFPLPPRPLLRSLNGGRRGTQQITIPLRSGARNIGAVRLLTIRPHGFRPDHVEQARSAAECAGRLLALALDKASDAALHPEPRMDGRTIRFPSHDEWRSGFTHPRAS